MARFNGYSSGDLITNPGGDIESLLREEIKSEIDLTVTTVSGTDYRVSGLRSSVDDFYNGAYFVNYTNNWVALITDFTGSTKRIYMGAGTIAVGDKCAVTNIQPNIDEDSFDVVQAGLVATGTTDGTGTNKLIKSGENFTTTVLPGMVVENTTDSTSTYVTAVDSDTQLSIQEDIFVSGEAYLVYGKRYGWQFDRSMVERTSSQDYFNELCYESHCIFFRSGTDYKLVDLDEGNVVGTLDTPMFQDGRPNVTARLTPLQNIYTDFTLNYGFDHKTDTYVSKATVNKASASDSFLDPVKTLCLDAENDYKVQRKWEYNANWIQDDTTAVKFLDKMSRWLTSQRMVVEWTGSIEKHIQYEIGDRVLIDYDLMLPIGVTNSSIFMITGMRLNPSKKKVVLALFLLN